MAFPNTIKYYITGNGITTPSSSSESGSATGESASIKAPSRRAVGDHSHKPCEAYSQGTKRTGESHVHGNAKRSKPTPKASQGPSCDVQTIDVISNASDDHSTTSTIFTSSLDEDSLHNAIIRILPRVQPGLFPTQICDQLSENHPDICEKYRKLRSFKTTIHHTLTAMLKEKKVDRRNAMTENFGRSHQYVTLVQPEPVKSHLTRGAGTPNSYVDEADSFSIASTVSPIAAPQRQVQRKRSEQASPENVQTTTNPHTAEPPPSTATSRDEEIRSRPMEKSLEAGSKTQMTPQASATDQQSRLIISKVSETAARVSREEREKCTQPRALEPASNSVRMPSSRPSIKTQSVRPCMTTPRHNSDKPSQVLCVNSDDHFMPSSRSTQGMQSTEVLTVGEQHALPVKSPLPLVSCNRDPVPKPASSNNLLTEPLSGSCVTQRAEMEAPVFRDPLSHRGKAPDEQSSMSDNIISSGETEKKSLPSKVPSGDVSLQRQTVNTSSRAQNPPTAEAHLQMSRSSSAQSRTKTTTNADAQDSSSLAGSSASSGRLSISGSQSQPSFTAINPIRQPEVRSSTLSASTQTKAITALAPLRERSSNPIPVKESNAEGNGQNAVEGPQPRSGPDVPDISNSSVGLPAQPSRPSLYPPPQQTGQGSPTKVTRSDMAPVKQVKQNQCLRSTGQFQQNPLRQPLGGFSDPGSTGQAQQTVTVDLTKISQADERASRPTHMQANHRDRDALDLGNLVDSAREAADMRRKYGVEAKFFNTKRQNAESTLDELHKSMDANMKILSKRHEKIEELRKQFAEQESKVESEMKNIREQADRTRDMADKVILEWRNYEKLEEKAEREFANADREWKRRVQALGIF